MTIPNRLKVNKDCMHNHGKAKYDTSSVNVSNLVIRSYKEKNRKKLPEVKRADNVRSFGFMS